jgi:hypothetical protein
LLDSFLLSITDTCSSIASVTFVPTHISFGKSQPWVPTSPNARLSRATSRRRAGASDTSIRSVRSFGGPEPVLAYLLRYTHRVAISNRRLIAFDQNGLTFSYKEGAFPCRRQHHGKRAVYPKSIFRRCHDIAETYRRIGTVKTRHPFIGRKTSPRRYLVREIFANVVLPAPRKAVNQVDCWHIAIPENGTIRDIAFLELALLKVC